MTTIVSLFVLALFAALILSPLAGRLGRRYGVMDMPDPRKVHQTPTPRCGGAAIFTAFFLSLFISQLFTTNVSAQLVANRQLLFLAAGAVLVFGIGIIDDLRSLGAKTKFVFQILAASLAYAGGLSISQFSLFGTTIQFGVFSYGVTVFWFLLFMNAINLVDGLDGLASGVVFFAAMVMVILLSLNQEHLLAMLFAILAGSVLGFLRYNFNPASIFLGDGGTYFLGYVLAGLSIWGSVKSQMSAVVMIPVLALGIPLFDACLAPVRRFMIGKRIFQPDKEHIHHRLLAIGMSSKNAVLFLYALSLGLCAVAIVLVNVQDETAGMFLIILGAGAFVFIRKLGYFDYLASDKILYWVRDLSDEAGLTTGRRTFLGLQMHIGAAKTLAHVWDRSIRAFEMLEFDIATVYLNMPTDPGAVENHPWACAVPAKKKRRRIPASRASASMRATPPQWYWMRDANFREADIDSRSLLRIELPLITPENRNLGVLVMLKNLKWGPLSQHTMRRVEHLRRTMVEALAGLAAGNNQRD